MELFQGMVRKMNKKKSPVNFFSNLTTCHKTRNDQSDYEQVSYTAKTEEINQYSIKSTNETRTLRNIKLSSRCKRDTGLQETKNYDVDSSSNDYTRSRLTSTVLKSNETFDTFNLSQIKETLTEEEEIVIKKRIVIVQEKINNKTFTSIDSCNTISRHSKSHYEHVSSKAKELSREIFICHLAYQATKSTHLDVKFGEKFLLLQIDSDFVLVRNLQTKKVGYVPRYCVTSLDQFLRDLKYIKKCKFL